MIPQRYCLPMATAADDRPDLGVLAKVLLDRLIERELVILDDLGLPMWHYVVMSALLSGPAPSQAELAASVGRDQTRVIPILDALEAQGYVSRTPDPDDRRHRVVALLDDGRRATLRARTRIRAMEDDLLSALPAGRRDQLVRDLRRVLASTEPED